MALVISENYQSRTFTTGRIGGQSGRELVYDILGGDPSDNDEDADVEALIVATAPAVYRGRVLDSVQAEPVGAGIWKGYARYVNFENNNEFTFDTGGGTSRILQSLGTINSYAPPGFVAPDFQGAIGVSDDRVEGVDIPARVFQFTETYYFADGVVNDTYKQTLFLMTGRFNNAGFRFFDAGECLLMGVSGAKRGDEQWGITFRFAGNPNITGATVGSITGIDKFGWDYLWVRHAEFEDTFAFCLVKRPIAAYIERVHEPGDFSTLGIGT